MNVRLIDLTDADLSAIVANAVRAELIAIRNESAYNPMQRLTKREAAAHLGLRSTRSLDARVAAGVVAVHYDAFNKPFFLVGELDGKMPVAGKGRGR